MAVDFDVVVGGDARERVSRDGEGVGLTGLSMVAKEFGPALAS